MELKEYNCFCHVDIAAQINNKWKDNSVLGIVKLSDKYSVLIKGKDKEKIKERFILVDDSRSNRVHNRKVIVIIYCYLLYQLLLNTKAGSPVLLCRDVRPEKFVNHYLQKIASFFKNREVLTLWLYFSLMLQGIFLVLFFNSYWVT